MNKFFLISQDKDTDYLTPIHDEANVIKFMNVTSNLTQNWQKIKKRKTLKRKISKRIGRKWKVKLTRIEQNKDHIQIMITYEKCNFLAPSKKIVWEVI